ncbi:MULTISPECIES: RNA polymerase sigma factor SigJ [Arthrobacter]|uniref:RNA polymerase sigma factor SigJ n=1 Tax=Arthrobacter caoxuetaonis TaxID=2886935 RepID=A0A9X1MI91_9MICC|nr:MULTISPECIES: RNA polymerase sigma factor SigJ [Arthrobacter]MCC3283814.1 RNA polymerase sigma factor SigJ [Arthrobacter caoxuetaonis]MCC3299044.1 RNA polymerase sigma factor SigJ [Arthrobacter caoxuetaonis]MCC9193252.1 RNA polymerase sigma factor SigJ [Arthrobacter sp. zg-Y916]USQ58617.1 RNA polymerase sigma factor SigJ [Arthrobacter caoxuetaonis]
MAEGSEAESTAGAAGGMGLTREVEFLAHRGMVFTIAYDITGTVADAEDVVQETYLRFSAVGHPVDNPRAYLARTAARQALNSVRASARRREEYIGDWLPEPLPTGAGEQADPQVAALTAAEVSTAMLVLMQSLNGPERAAFVLREVFGFEYREIAAALGAGEAAVRQLVHRAGERVRSGLPRTVPDEAEHRTAVERFLQAAMTGQVQDLLDVLAPEVVLVSDGGGKVSAARRPVYGPERVAALLLGLAAKYGEGAVPEFIELNGLPAVAFREDGLVTTVFQLSFRDGLVTGVFAMRNPEKLARLQP